MKSILVPDADQETNDLTKAVKWCVSQGIRGGCHPWRHRHTRRPYTWKYFASGRLQQRYKSRSCSLTPGHSGFMTATVTIDSRPGQQVSLFSLDPDSRRHLRRPALPAERS
ncbi:MAG: hypothetical protein MZV63_53830 [Marinilabiliales bacterium]|nr:hypothetical protein [Marinilabiliales bacterium]